MMDPLFTELAGIGRCLEASNEACQPDANAITRSIRAVHNPVPFLWGKRGYLRDWRLVDKPSRLRPQVNHTLANTRKCNATL